MHFHLHNRVEWLRHSHYRAITLGHRAFSQSLHHYQSTKELTEGQLKNLRANKERLMNDIHHTAQWGLGKRWGGKPTDVGMSRLALSDADKKVRDWFRATTEEIGCKVSIDSIGNMFAIRPGMNDGPPTVAGSHLDTQPTGGRYDGILGVCAGIEMLRTLEENDITTEYPIGVVNWTNEEGARFPMSMMASGVWAEKIPLQKAYDVVEVGTGGRTVKQELERIGYLGNIEATYRSIPLAAHFELHIEQGPILEASGQKCGIVEGVQGYRWYTITVTGRDCHTGTTNFENRADALLAASKMIVHSHNVASELGCLASSGILTLEPGSTNTVPGVVKFSLDIRSLSNEIVGKMETRLKEDFAKIAAGLEVGTFNAHNTGTRGIPCQVEWTLDFLAEPTQFHPDCIAAVEGSAKCLLGEKGVAIRRMVSGAGHDSVYANTSCPSSMIFVPCRDGVSHNPAEYCSPEDCENGTSVLIGSVVRYDRLRAS